MPEKASTISFRRNQFIFRQGARSDSLFYIETGTVKLTVTSSSGKEALIGFYDSGHLVGESCLGSDDALRFHNAVAVTNVQAARIDGAAARRRVRSDSTASYALLSWLLTRNKEIQQELVDQLLVSSEQRLLRILLSLAQVGVTDKTGVAPKLTQQDLANRIGLSRQRVNVLMARLKHSGVVDDDGGLKRGWALTKASKNIREL